MTNKKEMYMELIFGIPILIISIVFWIQFYKSKSIPMLGTSMLSTIVLIFIILQPFKDTRVGNILLKLFGLIIGILWIIFNYIASVSLIILAFTLCWAVFTWIFNIIISLLVNYNYIGATTNFEKSLVYCSTLFTAIVLSYYGETLVKTLDKVLSIGITNNNGLPKDIANNFLSKFNVRKRIYELSIILYILSVIEGLTLISIINLEFWNNYSTVSLEVMLTFIAIDSYVTTFNVGVKREKNYTKTMFSKVLRYIENRFTDTNLNRVEDSDEKSINIENE